MNSVPLKRLTPQQTSWYGTSAIVQRHPELRKKDWQAISVVPCARVCIGGGSRMNAAERGGGRPGAQGWRQLV